MARDSKEKMRKEVDAAAAAAAAVGLDDVKSHRPTTASGHWLRCALFSANLVAFVFGLVLFFLGLTLLAKHDRYDFGGSPLRDLSAWCAVAGATVCLVAFLGIYGSIKESFWPLVVYAALLCASAAAEVALAASAAGLAATGRATGVLEDAMRESMRGYGRDAATTKVWDMLQTDLKCCGASFPGDWAATPWSASMAERPEQLPDSCCPSVVFNMADTIYDSMKGRRCLAGTSRVGERRGCLSALKASGRRSAAVLAALAFVVALVQVGLVVAAVLLARRLRRGRRLLLLPLSCCLC